MKLSIIIPVYNAQEYIEKCIDCITSQRSNWSNVELVVCNDGSTDRSKEILDVLALKHSSLKLFHLDNKGVYKTRNFALSKITGDYVWMIDSDDYISENALSQLYNILSKESVEILNFGYFEQSAEGVTLKVLPPNTSKKIDGFTFLEKNDGRLFLWNNVYSVEFLINNGVKFLAKSVSLEDSLFNLTAFSKAKIVKYLNEALYTYCFNPNSISKKRNPKHILNLGESSKNVHLGTKHLRDTFIKGSREYIILDNRLMHSIQGFFYSLLLLKYPSEYISAIFKLYRAEKLLPINKKNDNIKLTIFQTLINLKIPFQVLSSLYRRF